MKHDHVYKNEVEMPHMPSEGHMMKGMGVDDYRKGADPIAYGQSGKPGMASDEKKIHSQMKQYHWET